MIDLSNDEVLQALNETELKEKILYIDKVYNELNLRQETFCDKFNIHCKKGCGSCCENFNPDITEVEALYLAYGLIKENKEDYFIELLDKNLDESHCPLYNPYDSEHHCMVYMYRPLICRLFNASCSKDKEGNPSFRRCKWNENENNISKDLFTKYKDYIVSMSDYGEKIEIENAGSTKTELIKDAVEKQIYKVKLIMELIDESKNGV